MTYTVALHLTLYIRHQMLSRNFLVYLSERMPRKTLERHLPTVVVHSIHYRSDLKAKFYYCLDMASILRLTFHVTFARGGYVMKRYLCDFVHLLSYPKHLADCIGIL